MVEERQWTVSDMAEIYTKYLKYAISICRHYGAANNAEDLAQSAFLHLFERFHQFRGDANLTTYLFRICRNETLMAFRKSSYKREITNFGLLNDDEYHGSLARLNTSLGHSSCQNHGPNRVAIKEMLKGLPKGYKNMLLLHEVLGYEHAEIGEILGCHPGNSKSQCHKGKKKALELLKRRA